MSLTEQEIAANPIGTHIIYEDEQVRVWNIVLEPGEVAPVHTHFLDYTTVVVEGDEIERYNGDGSADKLVVKPGAIMRWHQGPQVHSLRNTGSRRFHNVVVEIKGRNADFDKGEPTSQRSQQTNQEALVRRVPLARDNG
jgi:quercetin dioxygenase-like cupin family protein